MLTRRHTLVRLILIALLLPATPLLVAAQAKGFKGIVQHIEKTYQVKQTRIPFLGLANFFVKIIRPAGVKSFKLAVFQDQDFLATREGVTFESAMRGLMPKDWQPLVRVSSRASSNNRVLIYAKPAGKDLELMTVVLEPREAVVIQVRLNPDAVAKFMNDPRIMGISLASTLRGKSNNDPFGGGPLQSGVIIRNGRGGEQTSIGYRIDQNNPDYQLSGKPALGDPAAASDKPQSPEGAAAGARPKLQNRPDENGQPVQIDEAGKSPQSASTDARLNTGVNAAENAAGNATPNTAANTQPNTPPDTQPNAQPNTPAEEPVDPATRLAGTIRIDTQLVTLNVKAVDRAGQPLSTLSREDFVVYENGIRQEITHFDPVTAPINLILVLDLSGSTKDRRGVMLNAAKKFVDSLSPQDRVAVTAFTRDYYVVSDFTTDRKVLKERIGKLKDKQGGTSLYDAMWTTYDLLEQVRESRKAIVLLTDGVDESLIGEGSGSRRTFEELIGRVAEEEVTIYPIHLDPELPQILRQLSDPDLSERMRERIRERRLPRHETAKKQLETLAEATAGTFFHADDESDLEGVYQRVAAELRLLYSLAYSPESGEKDGRFRKINVEVKRDGVIARTRRGYYAK